MRPTLIAVFSLVAFSTAVGFSKSPKTLEDVVAKDIDSQLSDGMNEGNQEAHVIYKNDKPQVSCKLSNVKNSSYLKWAFCFVEFEVKNEFAQSNRKCGLLYKVDPRNPAMTLERGSEENTLKCLESLAEEID